MAIRRVLIVDDQHDIRRVLATGIKTLGEEVEVVEIPSGEEAILEVTRRPVDLLVTDVRLAGITGLELVNRIKKRNPGLKIILVTGVDDPKVRHQVADAGVDAYFYKPVHMADFLDAVERCLGLVETGLPLPPIMGERVEVTAVSRTNAELIANLRQELDAIAVILIDVLGEIIARSGDLPDLSVETEWLSTVVTALGASARLSHLLKAKTPEGFWCLRGTAQSLCVTHLGKSHAALIVTKVPLKSKQLNIIERFAQEMTLDVPALALEEEVGEVLAEAPVVTPPSEEEIPVEELPAEELPVLDALFSQAAQLKVEDLDAFWSTASQQENPEGISTAKTLTYDQAIKLGLAPTEGQGEKK
jgi:CheY-like chemotaxis protein